MNNLQEVNDPRPLMVTIRCITYNHEPYIRQCLEGFVMQKTNFKFEAIVHDDASTDGTASIIREYAEKYPEIIKPIYETENQYSKGDGSLKRIMDEHTHGKYVAMCEGDDYWTDPLKLQRQVDFLESHSDYSMCFHNAFMFMQDSFKVKLFTDYIKDADLTPYDAIHRWIVPTASILVRKHILVEYPEWVPRIYSGDYTLIIVCMYFGKVRYLNSISSVYRYCLTGGSASAIYVQKSIFVTQEHIRLLEGIDKASKVDFYEVLQSRIHFLKRKLRYCNARKTNNPIGLLMSLDFILKGLKRKSFEVIKKIYNM